MWLFYLTWVQSQLSAHSKNVILLMFYFTNSPQGKHPEYAGVDPEKGSISDHGRTTVEPAVGARGRTGIMAPAWKGELQFAFS